MREHKIGNQVIITVKHLDNAALNLSGIPRRVCSVQEAAVVKHPRERSPDGGFFEHVSTKTNGVRRRVSIIYFVEDFKKCDLQVAAEVRSHLYRNYLQRISTQ